MEIHTLNCSLLKVIIPFNNELGSVFEEEADESLGVEGGILIFSSRLNRSAGRGGGGGGAGKLAVCELVGIGGGGARRVLIDFSVSLDAGRIGSGETIGALDCLESLDLLEVF